MPSSRSSLAGLAALAALAATQPAQATVMQAVYRGTVTRDLLGTGADLFGLEQSKLVGSAFTMTFRYDTALGRISGFGNEVADLTGGFGGATSPILLAQVRVNGVTRSVDGSALGNIELNVNFAGVAPFDCTLAEDFSTTGDQANDLSIPVLQGCVFKPGFPMTTDFEAPFAIHGGEDRLNSVAQVFTRDAQGVLREVAFTGNATDLVVTRFDPSAAVPEPAAWALMIAGFGLAGARLRARRRLAV